MMGTGCSRVTVDFAQTTTGIDLAAGDVVGGGIGLYSCHGVVKATR